MILILLNTSTLVSVNTQRPVESSSYVALGLPVGSVAPLVGRAKTINIVNIKAKIDIGNVYFDFLMVTPMFFCYFSD